MEDKSKLEENMQAALEEANKALELDEVPIGAVIIKDNKIIGRGYNLVESKNDPSAHAEILAIQDATKNLANWRLNDCELYVTLEPCSMCIGAIKLARVSQLIVAAMDPEKGACGSLFDLSIDKRLGPNPKVISGICEKESSKLLKDFFASKR